MTQYTATSEETKTEYTCNGTAIVGTARATATSNISYQDALNKASQRALELATQNALTNVSLYENCELQLITYSAEAIGYGEAFTKYGDKITSSATATATSTLSYDDAYEKALELANSLAQSTADHDVNVINSVKTGSSTGSCGNVKFQLVPPNGSYDISSPENDCTTCIIVMPEVTPSELLNAIDGADKVTDIDYNISILNNGVQINILRLTPIGFVKVMGTWYNIVFDYVEYLLKAYNKLTNTELEQIDALWG
jgi:hypothetical protein